MSGEIYEPKPVPATADAMNGGPEDFEKFKEEFLEDKYVLARTSLRALCTAYGVHTPEELLTQSYSQEGSRVFIENSELFRFLPNFEILVLKAVESNNYAASVFIKWFAKHQFIQMEFYEEILDTALKTDKMHSLKDENLPEDFEKYTQNTEEEITDMKYTKAQIEELQTTKDWSKLVGLQMRYKVAAGMCPQRIIYALEKLIKHNEAQLERMQEIFAEKERKM